MKYYTDRHEGSPEKTVCDISPQVWAGIASLITSFISRNYFSEMFPLICDDGGGSYGTDVNLLASVFKAEIPNISWPLETKKYENPFSSVDWAPNTLLILDILEFCYNKISKANQGSYHSFFKHYHLNYNTEAGRNEFIESVNTILDRNGIAYVMGSNGEIIRYGDEVFTISLLNTVFATGDQILDKLLQESRSKYLSPAPSCRKESVECLWDAWERLKTINIPSDKSKSVSSLIEKTADNENIRLLINEEAKKLTTIGNEYIIRHSEVGRIEINESKHFDYLYQRMFALIKLCLVSNKKNA